MRIVFSSGLFLGRYQFGYPICVRVRVVERFFNKEGWLQALDVKHSIEDDEEVGVENVEELIRETVDETFEEATSSRTLKQLENIESMAGISFRIECQSIPTPSCEVATTSRSNVVEVLAQTIFDTCKLHT